MNRKKKTFTPNMRMAALYLLMGVLLLLTVTLFSGQESMRATEDYFARTISFVKVQSTSFEKNNDTITAKALRRMAVAVRQLAENDALDLYDPESLRAETESLWLTGIAVLDENGKALCEYTSGNVDYAQFAESLREKAALNVLQNPQKTYLKRILLQDGTAVDVATHRAAAGDAILLAYRVTPPEFVEGAALSIQSVLDGYPQDISGTIFIVQDNKVIAANDPSLIGLYTTNSPLVQGIRKAGAPDTLTHTHDWANSGCYFGMYSNGQNFDLYIYIGEKLVFRNASSALLAALIFYLICMAVLQTLRHRSIKAAEQQKREQEQKYHAQLEEQNRKLEKAVRHEAAANRAKREFLFNMSHDIRTPMNAIIGMTDLALGNLDNRQQLCEYLEIIKTSSSHLLTLINDILDMSRIEKGQLESAQAPFNLSVEIDRFCSRYQLLMDKNGLNFLHDTDLLHCNCLGDTSQLQRIWDNLVSNACKFTPPGGTVTFSVRELPPTSDRIGWYQFTISDTGIGIDSASLPQLFEPFYRSSDVVSRHIEGSGLGLAIVKNIVDYKGGTISVASQHGEGTTFTVTLPLHFDTAAAVTVEKTAQLPGSADFDFTGKSFLLVEDHPINQKVAELILEKTGAAVTIAENGAQGVELFTASAPGSFDAILMDIQMPVMNGYEAAKAIRCSQHPQAATVPVIAMTANAFAEDIKNALAAGMNAHVAKPIDPQKLYETLAACLK